MPRVAVIVGSLRRESVNRTLARALVKLAAPKLELVLIQIDDVPLFNQDLEADLPAPVRRLKADIEAADAVLFVTPEYNRSIPGVLKNLIDWASRPYGANSFAGKPAAIVGTSQGAVGTAAAQAHLRSIASVLTGPLMVQPEVYLVLKPDLIDAEGEVTVEATRVFLQRWVDRFAAWIAKAAG
jgi:chromate reductase, NAD(P)H dehydrogenase (quinone)